jgi:hypothetical protein
LKRVISELALNHPLKAVDEVYGWFESLQGVGDFRIDHFFEVLRQLDEAVQQSIRQLTRDYLHSTRLSKSEERRVWSLCYNYWGEVSILYARCIECARLDPKNKGSVALKPFLPLAAARLLAARATQLKWVEYRYGPIGEDLWRGLGQAYLAAEAAGYAQTPVQLYPAHSAQSSVAQQYLQVLCFYSASMDALMPLEIELADRIIAHFLPDFVFSTDCLPGSQYWVDPASGSPPVRMARHPDRLAANIRFYSATEAAQSLNVLIGTVERGEVPSDLNLGGEYRASALLPVLRHLALNWASEPAVREHLRHAVKTRIAVLQGFDDCFTVFSGGVARFGKERTAESWVVENVSLGGFGARVVDFDDSLRIGALLAIQAEGGDNWVLGVVRRVNKDSEVQARVGIQALSRNALSVELRPRTTGFSAAGAIPAIWLREESAAGEVRVVMPRDSFDVRVNFELSVEGGRRLLAPVELEDGGSAFEIGRYRTAESS